MMTFMIIDSNIMTSLMSYYINFDTEFLSPCKSFVMQPRAELTMTYLCHNMRCTRSEIRSSQFLRPCYEMLCALFPQCSKKKSILYSNSIFFLRFLLNNQKLNANIVRACFTAGIWFLDPKTNILPCPKRMKYVKVKDS